MKPCRKLTALFLSVLLLVPLFCSCKETPEPPQETPTEQTGGGETPDTAETTSAEAQNTEESQPTMKRKAYQTLNYPDVKAMWLSQYDLNAVYCTGGVQRPEAVYQKMLERVLDNVAANGFNTVIVQVRPNADSMYPSEYYPMSSYVVGAYGKEAAYDPFALLIREAHERELSVQAWINPLRGMSESAVGAVPSRFAIRRWYADSTTKGKYVVVVNKTVYLNPAYPEVRQLIIDGAREIAEKYDVDGLHMDDYFYPTQDASFDLQSYRDYTKGGGKLALADFRREALNQLVGGIYASVKETSEDILFGISPAGVIDTVFNKQYADVYTWCSSEGYIDYICPQVYFGLEHGTCDFVKICGVWQNIIKTDRVKLIIGMTLGKAKSKFDQYAGSGQNEWANHDDILLRCLEYTKSLERCTGTAYFCYQYFYDPASGAETVETRAERNHFLPLLKEIRWNTEK